MLFNLSSKSRGKAPKIVCHLFFIKKIELKLIKELKWTEGIALGVRRKLAYTKGRKII
jgi:hypothetical protein